MKSFKTLLLMSLAFPLASEAQTASDQNEGSRIDFNSETHSGTFSWFGHNARTYFILKSDDLSTWTYAPIIESGLGQAITWNFSSTQSKFFARLRHTDIPMPDPRTFDIDGDSVGNQDELNQDTDPFASLDLDLNQIPDDWELYWKDQFAVYPNPVVASLTHRQSMTKQLFLNNPVSPDADFAVTVSGNAAGTKVYYDYEDSLIGNAVYDWTEISATGVLLTGISEHDDAAEEILLNSNFPFYGVNYSRLHVASNGMITFGSPHSEPWNRSIPSRYSPDNYIALFWDDLNTNDVSTGDGGSVYYQAFSDRIIIQYESVMRDRDSDPATQTNTFQAVLYDTGLIKVFYKEMGGYMLDATVGIENMDGSRGLEVVYNEEGIHPSFVLEDELAITFSPRPALFVEVSPLTGTTAAGNSSALDVRFEAHDLAPGTYTAGIEIAHTGAGTSPWHVPAVLEVVNPPTEISIDLPVDGAVLWSGENIFFSVVAVDNDFGIESIKFYDGSTELHEDTSPSYRSSYSWPNPSLGTHILKAQAIDKFGEIATSETVQITVLEDLDSDHMEDAWELLYFGDLDEEASSDFDGDGIPNAFEYRHGTDPTNSDADPNTADKPIFSEIQEGTYKYYIVDQSLLTETDYRKRSIRTVINLANDYDIIEVRPGAYNESIGTLSDRLYIFSAPNSSSPVFDVSGLNTSALYLRSESVFSGLTFRGGSSSGGAVSISISGEQNKPRFIGCKFIDNEVRYRDGVIFVRYGDPIFISCTIAGNRVASGGAAIYNYDNRNDIRLINTLLWNDESGADEVAGATSSITYQNTLSRNSATGQVTIDGVDQGSTDPGLNHAYRLLAGSPAIDAGSAHQGEMPHDSDGEPRINPLSNIIDIGADEFYDFDGDVISDQDELDYGTDPEKPDTDGDLLSDFDELFVHGTIPYLYDSDSDGLSDFDEINTHRSDPLSPDSDGDQLPDAWEILNGTNINVADAASSADSDSLTNWQEYIYGTAPGDGDTDADGVLDHLEIFTHLTNPLVADTDGDGLLDGYELNTSLTDPLNRDSDGDQMPDGWEVVNLLDPLVDDAAGNPDSDAYLNLSEYKNGKDPQVPETTTNLPSVGLKVATELE